MLSSEKRIEPERPPVDEWGIYDPDQAGLAAVLARIEARRRAGALHAADAATIATSMRDANALTNKDKK